MARRDLESLKSMEMSALEKEGAELVKKACAEGAVLLENNGVLPLKPCKVALYGFGARQVINTGIGSGDVVARYIVNFEDGLKNSGYEIVSEKWLDMFDVLYAKHRRQLREQLMRESDETGIDCVHILYAMPHEHIACQKIMAEDMPDAEAAVYVLSRKEGEGCDNIYARGGYLPCEWELEHLRTLRKRYGKLILLLNIGSVLDMNEILEIGPDAVLLVYQGGAEIGNAAAEIIKGSLPPSGRLSTTWAKKYWDYASSSSFGRNVEGKKVPYREGIYVGYRYFDSFGVDVLYPFGYGLSYTSFEMEMVNLEEIQGKIRVKVRVTNTGTEAGQEVVQLYVSAPAGKLDKVYQELAGFAKTELLNSGEKQVVTLEFALAEHASYDTETQTYFLEGGTYLLRLGSNCTKTKIVAALQLEQDCVVKQVKNIFTVPCEFEELRAEARREDKKEKILPGIPCLKLHTEDYCSDETVVYHMEKARNLLGGPIDPESVNLSESGSVQIEVPDDVSLESVRQGTHTLEQLVASMDIEELAHLTTGQLFEKEPYRLKCYSPHVLGACGETTGYFQTQHTEKKIPYLITCDGGGGLRLIRRFQTDENGEIIYQDPLQNFENGEFALRTYEEGRQNYYQYTTTLPIATLLACTWNVSLLEKLGSIVGSEMERYGIDLWLAPGINLHRNPLGGRNFEYFSEDPVLSAFMAGAIVRGVQSHPGKGTVVKHFAANNQETLRTSHIACISERTMRELYLRSFELMIYHAKPVSIMLGLHCVNGPHATNSRELATYIVRDEWQYTGAVMTDWNTTRKDRGASTAACIIAGASLIMPGSNRDLANIKKALTNKSGKGDVLCLGELQKSAGDFLSFLLGMTVSEDRRNAV